MSVSTTDTTGNSSLSASLSMEGKATKLKAAKCHPMSMSVSSVSMSIETAMPTYYPTTETIRRMRQQCPRIIRLMRRPLIIRLMLRLMSQRTPRRLFRRMLLQLAVPLKGWCVNLEISSIPLDVTVSGTKIQTSNSDVNLSVMQARTST